MKYIITNYNNIIIGNGVNHIQLNKAAPINSRVVGAGEMSIINGKVNVWGKSFGYNIESKPEDAILIQKLFPNQINENSNQT